MKLNGLVLIVLSTLVFGTSGANAESRSYKKGIVKNIDVEKKEITLENKKTGELEVYPIPSSAKIDIDRKKYQDLSVLKEGDEVKLKFRERKKANKIKGEIVSIDYDAYSVVIRDRRSRQDHHIQFSKDVNVSGRYQVSNFNDLQKGHIIELHKYSSVQPQTAMRQ